MLDCALLRDLSCVHGAVGSFLEISCMHGSNKASLPGALWVLAQVFSICKVTSPEAKAEGKGFCQGNKSHAYASVWRSNYSNVAYHAAHLLACPINVSLRSNKTGMIHTAIRLF